MTKRKLTKHEDDILRNIRQPDRYDPKARSIGGPWRMVKCKDGAYVCYEQHLEIIDNLRKNAEINDAQSPHDGIHTCSKGCKKPGCKRGLRDTIEEQDAKIEALKHDLLEKAAELRRLHQERVHDIGMLGEYSAELARLKAEVDRLRASSFVTAVPVEEYEKLKAERDAAKRCWDSMKEEWDKLVDENIRLRKAGDAMAETFVDCLVSQRLFPSDSPSLKRWIEAKKGNANE